MYDVHVLFDILKFALSKKNLVSQQGHFAMSDEKKPDFEG